jgi:hypothetical protein
MVRSLLQDKIHDYMAHLSDLNDFVARRFLTHTSLRQLEDMVNQ